jgi:hypothetical protein
MRPTPNILQLETFRQIFTCIDRNIFAERGFDYLTTTVPRPGRIEPFLVSDDAESPVGVEVAAEVV